jgi:hypothetical protein
VFGDFEVVEESERPIDEQVCQVPGLYYCQGNILYLCVEEGATWSRLLACSSTEVCDVMVGACVGAQGTTGASASGGDAADVAPGTSGNAGP